MESYLTINYLIGNIKYTIYMFSSPRISLLTATTTTYTQPPAALLSLFKIHIARKLATSRISSSIAFTSDFVTLLAHHLYRFISTVVVRIKEILALQRRTVPNVLHVVIAVFSTGGGICFSRFMEWVLERCQSGDKIGHLEMSKLIASFENLFANSQMRQKQQKHSTSIYSVPTFCLSSKQSLANPFHTNNQIVSESLKKPNHIFTRNPQASEICYLESHQQEGIERKIVQAEREMRVIRGGDARKRVKGEQKGGEQQKGRKNQRGTNKFRLFQSL